MDNDALQLNTPVRFTLGPLGTLDAPEDGTFTDHLVQRGALGLYLGRHPNPGLYRREWHLISVEAGDRTLYVPCPRSWFEAAEEKL